MKQTLLTRLSMAGLMLALLLSCLAGCSAPDAPDAADTTAGHTSSEAEVPTSAEGSASSDTSPEDTTGSATSDSTADGESDTTVSDDPAPSVTFPTSGKDMTDILAEINCKQVTDFEETEEKSEFIKIVVQGYGEIVVRLRTDIAPANAGGIQWLIPYNYYKGLTFHRVLKDSFIQGGCPNGDGTGGSGISLRGEFADNGVNNPLLHVRGVVSAHREEENFNSASTQFLILTQDCPQFDGNRTAFGYVVAGMDVVDAIADASVKDNGAGEISAPAEKIVMEKIVFVKLK